MTAAVSDAEVARATLRFIEDHHGQLLLHAGAAAAKDGRTVIVHGASGAGKTTLTAALVTIGLGYVTDETVCLDPATLEIEPFPKPLTVKPGSQQILRKLRPPRREVVAESGNWQLLPARLGGIPLPDGPLKPAVIVFPDVSPAAQDVSVVPVSRAYAAFLLGEQSSALWRVKPRPLAALSELVSVAPAYAVTYGDAFSAADFIRRTLLAADR